MELISKTRILGEMMGAQRAPRAQRSCGLDQGGRALPVRAGQRWADAWAHASGDSKAVVVWTDDGCPFACADAVVALVVLARLAS